ncbi:MarR family winged helix-turn-helix transcriptional regulator [Streptacidiphilus sp. EB129]|uniref:MarR family winged helix-turn-helix transcriptional regulator n=1 Tax=Streptacidiphilus sp. EB129 TaxID=3156262 RepID=UPI00351996CC
MPPSTTASDLLDGERAEAVDAIQRELTAFARRARSLASQIHPGLTLVTFTILDHLNERGGCRGTDLAAHFMLDKSTVSRQVASLEKLGLVERTADPEDLRGQIIRPSTQGADLLRQVLDQRHRAYLQRLRDWDKDDLERFAAYLARYNASA